jgi:uncharacterized protein YbjQ (UPF0145 family)
MLKGGYTMILVNTDYIEGKKFEMIGLVKGSMIQSVHFGKDIVNSFKTLVGGELTSYTEMMNEARAVATRRMSEEAEAIGADAVVNIRYTSSQVVQGAAEVMAYGTAVKFVD